MRTGVWYENGADDTEWPTLTEAIRFASDMQLLEEEPNPYDDDPRVLYRGGEVLE